MEIRLHGRGGQGGVTCAKILAAAYAELGKAVQAFGDYASERSGAPVRAYTRVSDGEIKSRNKVYDPDHVVVLDQHLLGADVVAGLAEGGTLLVNSPEPPEVFAERFPGFRVATVDATEIARRHKIGTRSVVIINTTIAGAFAKMLGIPMERLESVYRRLGFLSNFDAAKEAAESLRALEADGSHPAEAPAPPPAKEVRPLVEHTGSQPTGIKTGAWRSQQPRYVENEAPCNAFCPAGNDVVGFVQALARSGEEAGAAVLARSNPLAGTCGRVCPAPCMAGCNRTEYDGAVNIRGLERWIADHAEVARPNGGARGEQKRVAIIGGGPAGLAAAYEIARAGHAPTIIEAEEKLGGLLLTGIPSYRLPHEVVEKEIAGILELGVDTRLGTRLSRTELAKLPDEFDAIIVSTGLQKLRGLDAPGADLDGIEQGIGFLRRLNLGATPEVSGEVVVLGGGNSAIDCARSALRAGASKVTVAYRRTAAEMPAIEEEVEQAVEEGVTFLFQRQPVGFEGLGKVAEITLAEVEMGEPDETGRRRPLVTDRTETLPCDHVLLALGQSADRSILPEGWQLRDGRVHRGVDALRVFAAGDVSTGEGTVTHAVGSGRRAAGLALQELGVAIKVFERPDRDAAVPVTRMRLDHFARSEPAQERTAEPKIRLRNFEPVSQGLIDSLESHRCFSCGHCTRCDTCMVYCPEGSIQLTLHGYEVDYSYCKGCGICVAECPREGMEMVDL